MVKSSLLVIMYTTEIVNHMHKCYSTSGSSSLVLVFMVYLVFCCLVIRIKSGCRYYFTLRSNDCDHANGECGCEHYPTSGLSSIHGVWCFVVCNYRITPGCRCGLTLPFCWSNDCDHANGANV